MEKLVHDLNYVYLTEATAHSKWIKVIQCKKLKKLFENQTARANEFIICSLKVMKSIAWFILFLLKRCDLGC